MSGDMGDTIYTVTTWILPVLFAITLHEAAHGFVAFRFGDDTAMRMGRVSANPLRHIDLFGTILLPGILLLIGSPFLFGYAKPVPVNFMRLRSPKRDSVWVAGAGPACNLAQAFAAGLAAHLLGFFPTGLANWLASNLENAIVINVVLAVFNMIPLPPLDGGRVAVGLLPRPLALPLARIEPYGMAILIALIFGLRYVSDALHRDVDLIGWLIAGPADFLYRVILTVTGNG